MGLKFRLSAMQFLQFFIWGSWLMTIGTWWFHTQKWSGTYFGIMFSTIGIASLLMPTVIGIIADRWLSAEKLYGLLHIGGALMLFAVPHCSSPFLVFIVMLINMCLYSPSVTLSISISYSTLEESNISIVDVFPKIRVLGTVGFIVAMWTISLLQLEKAGEMFYVASIASLVLGVYAFSLPNCPPLNKNSDSLVNMLGLNAFRIFKSYKIAVFFFFCMLLGGALQLTNAYGDTFLHSFSGIVEYKDCLAVKYPAIILSISQISEAFCILLVPFFLKKYGIKVVMLLSMAAWVLRFGLFGFGNPGDGLWMIVLSCIIYGFAFDFFNITSSIYTELQVSPDIRSSAQGLLSMVIGVGMIFGSSSSGWIINSFYTSAEKTINWQGWHGVWILFAVYALIILILFLILFKHKHTPEDIEKIKH